MQVIASHPGLGDSMEFLGSMQEWTCSATRGTHVRRHGHSKDPTHARPFHSLVLRFCCPEPS